MSCDTERSFKRNFVKASLDEPRLRCSVWVNEARLGTPRKGSITILLHAERQPIRNDLVFHEATTPSSKRPTTGSSSTRGLFNMTFDNSSAGRIYGKLFLHLESNPDVFTEPIHELGITESLSFQDELSLDDPELLALLPRPAYALILVCAMTDVYQQRYAEEEARLVAYEGCNAEEDFVFFKETNNTACGLYGIILHAVCK